MISAACHREARRPSGSRETLSAGHHVPADAHAECAHRDRSALFGRTRISTAPRRPGRALFESRGSTGRHTAESRTAIRDRTRHPPRRRRAGDPPSRLRRRSRRTRIASEPLATVLVVSCRPPRRSPATTWQVRFGRARRLRVSIARSHAFSVIGARHTEDAPQRAYQSRIDRDSSRESWKSSGRAGCALTCACVQFIVQE